MFITPCIVQLVYLLKYDLLRRRITLTPARRHASCQRTANLHVQIFKWGKRKIKPELFAHHEARRLTVSCRHVSFLALVSETSSSSSRRWGREMQQMLQGLELSHGWTIQQWSAEYHNTLHSIFFPAILTKAMSRDEHSDVGKHAQMSLYHTSSPPFPNANPHQRTQATS